MLVWDKHGVPHRNWVLRESEDLEEAASHVCEMCGQTGIRYVHYLTHADYDGVMAVGGVCAENMGVRGTKKRETLLKNRQSRRRNWTEREWQTTRQGNLRKRKEGMLFLVEVASCRASVHVDGQWVRVGAYASVEEAKAALFDTGWPSKISD